MAKATTTIKQVLNYQDEHAAWFAANQVLFNQVASLSIVLKVWTGSCWSWIKGRITGRELPVDVEMGSPSLIRRGNQWWLHTPIEKQLSSPPKIEKQVRANAGTKICAVDLNMNEQLAVCTIQTVEGTILATRFIGGGRSCGSLDPAECHIRSW